MNTLGDLLRITGARNSPGGQDSVLAHITPKEARLLKMLGGVGKPDPITGALHFYGDGSDGGGGGSSGSEGEGESAAASEASESAGGMGDGDAGGGGAGAGGGGAGGGGDGEGESQAAQEAAASAGAIGNGPTNDGLSQGPNGETAAFGTYSGWDFDTYGYGDPSIGYAASEEEAAALEANAAALAANTAQMNAALAAAMADPVTGRTAEEQFQYDASLGTNQAQGPNAPQAALDAANAEYNSLGWSGALQGTPWGFVDALGNQQTNWGSVGRDAASAIGQFGSLAGALSGYGAVGAGIGALANLALGNYAPGLGTVGGLIGGMPGSLAGSILGSLASGKEASALGTLANAGLNMSGYGLGGLAAGQFAPGSWESMLAGSLGSMAQGWGTGQALAGLGLENSGTGFGGFGTTGTTGGTTGEGGNGDTMFAGGSPTFDEGSGGQGSSGNTLAGLLALLGGQNKTTGQAATGYTPITLDTVNSETGYDLIDEGSGDNTLGGLMNIANAKNLYASSYGG